MRMFNFRLTLDLLQIITLLGILIAFLLSGLFVLTQKLRTKANIFLVIFMMTLSLNSLYYLSIDLGFGKTYKILNFIHFSIPVLIPVSAYFYVFYLRPIPQKKVMGWFEWIILVPVVLDVAFFSINGFCFHFWGEKSLNRSLISLLNIVEEIMVMVSALILLPCGIWLLQDYKRKLKESHSHIDKISLSWLANMLSMYLATLILWIPPYLGFVFTDTLTFAKYYPLWISSGVIACWIGAKGFLQPELFSFKQEKNEDDIIQVKEMKLLPPPRELTALAPEQEDIQIDTSLEQKPSNENLEKYLEKLSELILKDKIFKEPELYSNELARRIGISTRLLTTILSKKLQTNFHDYINQARIEEIKIHLNHPDYKDYTIYGLALENGFNSKDAFHRNFKKYTGMTPSEYKKNEKT